MVMVMEIYTREEFRLKQELLERKIVNGAVFIYATDTIYGIGCNARLPEAVKRIRDMKGTPNPFSVIAPSKEWIKDNCYIPKEAEEWLGKLPGPYTLIFKLKNKNVLGEGVTPGNHTLGVRIPDHWCREIAKNKNIPIITTSANRHGGTFMTSLESLDADIKSKVDFIIYEGKLKGKPSTLVRFEDKVKIQER